MGSQAKRGMLIATGITEVHAHNWIDTVNALRQAALEAPARALELAKQEPDEARRMLLTRLGRVAAAERELENARNYLSGCVADAREVSAGWTDIGRVLGITSQAARRRFDREARQVHSGYKRSTASDGSTD
jgi:hypothetical protein